MQNKPRESADDLIKYPMPHDIWLRSKSLQITGFLQIIFLQLIITCIY
jgi:hypothetical protein